MNHMIRFALSLGVVAVLILGVVVITAQDGVNLLQDPGFEGPYVGRGRPDLNTSSAWNLWLATGPQTQDWQNRADKVFGFPHITDPEKRTGNSSQNLNGGFVTFTAALYQQVSVPANQNVTASAWARLKTCNIPANADNCGSAVESGAFVRVGIDPTGGTDPNSPNILWSGNIQPHDRWDQASVSATARGAVVTMFIYTTQNSPSQLNNLWVDDAFLGVGGAGGSSPDIAAPPPPAPQAFPTAFIAVRQPPRPDGSVVHIVSPGDTLTGIATAYRVPIETILEQNQLVSARYILVGQQLVIRPAGSELAATPNAPASGGFRPLPDDLFSAADLANLNPNPGPTPMRYGR